MTMQEGATLLEAHSISKHFGGLAALSEVSLSIRKGEIYGLIGPNGAGKTTLFNTLTGLYQASSGEFTFNGQALDTRQPHLVAKAGIARTFQNIRLFHNMSALENVMVGRHVRTKAGVLGAVLRDRATRAEEAKIRHRAQELLEYVGVSGRAADVAKHLPYGDQRRLEIARAQAAGEDPRRRHHDPADRARREAGDGLVRSSCGAGLRKKDRRGTASQRAA